VLDLESGVHAGARPAYFKICDKAQKFPLICGQLAWFEHHQDIKNLPDDPGD
jgi:hypothetical protein